MSSTSIDFDNNVSGQTYRISVHNFPVGKYSNVDHDWVSIKIVEEFQGNATAYHAVSISLTQAQELRERLDAALDRFENERPPALMVDAARPVVVR